MVKYINMGIYQIFTWFFVKIPPNTTVFDSNYRNTYILQFLEFQIVFKQNLSV